MKASEYAKTIRPSALHFARDSRKSLLVTAEIEAMTGRTSATGQALGQQIRRGVLEMISDAKVQERRILTQIAQSGDWEWGTF